MRKDKGILFTTLLLTTFAISAAQPTRITTLQSDKPAPRATLQLSPIETYSFHVEFNGEDLGSWSKVSGLEVSWDVVEYRNGSSNAIQHKLPGRQRVSDVTLTKGVALSPELRGWWQNIRSGNIDRRDISIVLTNQFGVEVRRWDLFDAWPRRWKVNGFDGKGNDVVTEEITFVVEEVTIH